MARSEFLALRPTELISMARAHRRVFEAQQWRDAHLMACIVNSGFCRPKDDVKPEDFMPKKHQAKAPRRKRMTQKQRDLVAEKTRKVFDQLMKSASGPRTG